MGDYEYEPSVLFGIPFPLKKIPKVYRIYNKLPYEIYKLKITFHTDEESETEKEEYERYIGFIGFCLYDGDYPKENTETFEQNLLDQIEFLKEMEVFKKVLENFGLQYNPSYRAGTPYKVRDCMMGYNHSKNKWQFLDEVKKYLFDEEDYKYYGEEEKKGNDEDDTNDNKK